MTSSYKCLQESNLDQLPFCFHPIKKLISDVALPFFSFTLLILLSILIWFLPTNKGIFN